MPTKEQFSAYVKVQFSGRYNMFDPYARICTGLDKDTYISVMKNYSELAEQYPEIIKEAAKMTNQELKEMSTPEKDILSKIIDESPVLEYELKELKMPVGYEDELVYEIPDTDKEKILKELWPFATPVTLETIFFDIHEQSFFKMRGFKVIRSRNRNFICSPYYARSGGMVVDFISPENTEGMEVRIVK